MKSCGRLREQAGRRGCRSVPQSEGSSARRPAFWTIGPRGRPRGPDTARQPGAPYGQRVELIVQTVVLLVSVLVPHTSVAPDGALEPEQPVRPVIE